MPIRATQGSAGFDIFAMEDVYLLKRATVKVPIGIRMQIPCGYYGQLLSRSSLAAQNITVDGGVIDSNYRGEICVLLKNKNDPMFSPQLFIVVPEEELTSTGRGIGGFGLTDYMQRI
ncbi:deoxyuridine 5'-triphosphate nucleotidohydrolase-like [Hydra vulgaris]|uniref:deoxyuridine 5'-triphosphate nucleotidohydrolase-like n=1 Tax=Hydra vulgaris TaxID=6087 RepID=UPI0032EA7BD2